MSRKFAMASILATLLAFGVLSILIRGGFRANITPSRTEAVVARTMRNLSIPGDETTRRNPFEEGSDATGQGRDLFLNHCAGCHGFDGSAQTQVGLNLYPRAADLRAPATQNLTDGELHYIVENGVRFTGMPALGKEHAQSSDDSWKLVLFIRSLGRSGERDKSQSLESAHYVGSQLCEKCHATIYARWKKTPMANVVRDPREHPEAIVPDLATNNVSKFNKDQVAFVYGSLWKQRYFTKVGDDYFPLSAKWVVGMHTWRPYKVPSTGADWWTSFYPDDNMQRPTGRPVTDATPSTKTFTPSR